MAPGDTGQESGFTIDGKFYPPPTLESFEMGELRVMYDYSGIVQEDFVQAEDETDDEHGARITQLVQHPGFMQTLMHVAFQRGNPTLKRDRVAAVIESTNYLEAVASLQSDEPDEDDAGPPDPSARTSEPSGSLPSGSSESKSSRKLRPDTPGNGSGSGSAEPARTPASTGTGASGTSSPELDQAGLGV